jgi:hypothetical protein
VPSFSGERVRNVSAGKPGHFGLDLILFSPFPKMRTVMTKRSTLLGVLVATALATAASAQSPHEDAYVACLVGQAAVAIHAQAKPDAKAAQARAYKVCKEPRGLSSVSVEGIGDYVNLLVMSMAGEGCNSR